MSSLPGLGSEKDDFSIPDSIEPIRAFRGWKLLHFTENDSVFLTSTSNGTIWIDGEMEAKELPTLRNKSGVYATKDLEDSMIHLQQGIRQRSIPGIVYGEVDLWGKVIEHDTGYRAQYAKISTFYVRSSLPQIHDSNSLSTYRLAEQFGIPVVEHEDAWLGVLKMGAFSVGETVWVFRQKKWKMHTVVGLRTSIGKLNLVGLGGKRIFAYPEEVRKEKP